MNRAVLPAALFLLSISAPFQLAAQPFAPPPETAPSPSLTLPNVNLAPLEAKVAAQLRDARDKTVTLLARPEADTNAKAESLGELAQLYHVYGLADAARSLYTQAAGLTPNDFRWPYLGAVLAQGEGDLASAERGYRQALALRADWVPGLIHLAETLLASDRSNEAETLLRQALSLAPESAAAKASLGQIALSRRNYREAADQLEAALRSSPEATRLHHPLGLAYRGLGEVEKARQHLTQAGSVGITPADPLLAGLEELRTGEGPRLRQGYLLLRNQRPAEALVELRQAIEANPKSSAARIGVASSLIALGQPDGLREAIEQLRTATHLAPESAVAHFDLGIALRQAGLDDEALKELSAATRLDPGDAQAQLESGRIHEQARRLDEAEASYRRAAELAPLDEEAQMAAANLLVQRERYAAAIGLLSAAREGQPRSFRITFALARLLAGSPDLALRDGAKALPLAAAAYQTRRSVGTAETLALALAELGRCGEAAERQREAVEIAKEEGVQAALPKLEADLRRYETVKPGGSCRAIKD